MNEDEMQALEPQAGEALDRMLARYARVRLDPSAAESRRARSVVMAEAWRRRLDLADATTADPSRPAIVGAGHRRGPFARWGARRMSAALAAAMIGGLLVGSTSIAASRAGGPLYETRLALEELVLPADPASRVEAQIAWAQARLAEVVDASGRNDQGALSAALAAYERTTDTLGATTGEPAVRAQEAVASHRAVLARVAATASASALVGLDRALAASDTAIERLAATVATQPGDGAGGGGAGGSGNGSGSGGAGNSGGGAGNSGGSGNGNAGGSGNGNAGGSGSAGAGGTGNGNAGGTGNGNAGGTGTGPQASARPAPVATPNPERTPAAQPDRTHAPRPTKAPDDTQRRTPPPVPASPAAGKP